MTDFKKKLGNRIQEIRKSKKFTQEKLAEAIDMDTPNLSNIERGKKFMTADTLCKIANSLNIPIKELFDFEHIKSNNELILEITELLPTLSDQELKFCYKTITNLIQMRK